MDLSGTVSDAQAFLDDMIKISRPQSNKTTQVSVEDYVKLLENHQQSSHRFMHQACKNGKDLVEWYKEFARNLVTQFRTSNADAAEPSPAAIDRLNGLLDDLSSSDRDAILEEIDRHADYLQHLSDASTSRIQATLDKASNTDYGPGIYLARWQALLDDTLITPSKAEGAVRKAGSEEAKEASREDVDGEKKGDVGAMQAVESEHGAPEVGVTIKLLMSKFWEMLRAWGQKT